MKDYLSVGPVWRANGSRSKGGPEERRKNREGIVAPENLSQNRRKNRRGVRIPQEKMERAKGFEPSTLTLATHALTG